MAVAWRTMSGFRAGGDESFPGGDVGGVLTDDDGPERFGGSGDLKDFGWNLPRSQMGWQISSRPSMVTNAESSWSSSGHIGSRTSSKSHAVTWIAVCCSVIAVVALAVVVIYLRKKSGRKQGELDEHLDPISEW